MIWPGLASALTSGPPTISDSLLASASMRPASRAARVGREADGAGDAVEHGVAVGARRARWPRPGPARISGSGSPGAVPRRPAPRAAAGTASSRATATVRTPQPVRLLGEQRDPAAGGGERGHPEAVGVAQHDVDGLGADRAGGAEDHDVAGAVVRDGVGDEVRVGEGVMAAHLTAPGMSRHCPPIVRRYGPRPRTARRPRCRAGGAAAPPPGPVPRPVSGSGRWTFSCPDGPGVASAIHGPSPRGVDDALLQPGVRAGQHAVDDLAVEVVGVGPQPAEQLLDADAGLPAEGVGELVGLAAVLAAGCAGARRGRRRRSSRTAPRRCRRSGRGSPAWSPSGPASGTWRRRSSGRACGRCARRSAGAAGRAWPNSA